MSLRAWATPRLFTVYEAMTDSYLVLVVTAHPERARFALVATLRCAVQQSVVGHRGLEAAGCGHVGPVNDPVRERVRAQARAFGDVPDDVRPAHARVLLDGGRDLALQERSQLPLGVEEAEVAVEVAAAARDPVDAPAHPLPVGDQLGDWRAGSEHQGGVPCPQVGHLGGQRVRDRGADWAA